MGGTVLVCGGLMHSGATTGTSNRFNGSVTVVDTTNGHVLAVIKVDVAPHGLTYFPQPGQISLGHNGVYR